MKFLTLTVALLAGLSAAYAIDYTNEIINAVPVSGGLSGEGHHTGYWDCCKPSCAWTGNAYTDPPVRGCAADGVTTVDKELQSGCASDGGSYSCTDQVAHAANKSFALGFTAASFTGGTDYSMCCRCVLLTWKYDTQDPKRQILVQITNTGGDLLSNQFDLAIPGCGVGYVADGCTNQWGAPVGGWGQQYGGVSTEEECSELPEELQVACQFRFEWMDVPDWTVDFVEVECPTALTDISQCIIS
ncbi:hypothetical protein NQ318_006806 [Aromia moschata]|uniref:cellulase n=1 Tax=Aromia moschata TaxID=1265417 RepID=A0AAV8XPH6_9CUCU|nr:hypothetical protein NQ318_006806 [Aromia moschata]